MYPKFQELVIALRGLSLGVILETNGLLVDQDRARFLKQMQVGQVAVSLDSDRPEEHNLFRGVPGWFRAADSGPPEADSR